MLFRSHIRASDAELMALYEANWMRESPQRLLPRQRVAAAVAALATVTLQRQQQQQLIREPLVNDLADPLTGSYQPVNIHLHDFPTAWNALWSGYLPHPLRLFGWKLLHGALPVGALRATYVKPGNVQQLREQCCQHPACQAMQPSAPIETLSHVFLLCPVALRAWWWLRRVWARLVPTAAPMPLNKRLLVAGEPGWNPGGGPPGLWFHLRQIGRAHV